MKKYTDPMLNNATETSDVDPRLQALLTLASNLSDSDLDALTDKALSMNQDNESAPACCPWCGGLNYIRYGRKCGKQRFLCKDEECGHTFVSTRSTIMYMSHQPKSVWREVIRDTLGGMSLEYTRKRLAEKDIRVSHKVLFFMRHKILIALQAQQELKRIEEAVTAQETSSGLCSEEAAADVADWLDLPFDGPSAAVPQDDADPDAANAQSDPDVASTQPGPDEETAALPSDPDKNVYEVDETYILESFKGSKVDLGKHGREARKRGSGAQKRGISNEYLCVVAGVSRQGRTIANTVNRATPSVDELQQALADRLPSGSLVLCDGQTSYPKACASLGCTMRNVNKVAEEDRALYNLNRVNNFHLFIKERIRKYRGIATCYLNRYNTLFAEAYKLPGDLIASLVKPLLTVSGIDFASTYTQVRTFALTSV